MDLDFELVCLFMGIAIGSATVPLGKMTTHNKTSGIGAIFTDWSGFILGLLTWIIGYYVWICNF